MEYSDADVVGSTIVALIFADWKKAEAIKKAKSKPVIICVFVVFLVLSLRYIWQVSDWC